MTKDADDLFRLKLPCDLYREIGPAPIIGNPQFDLHPFFVQMPDRKSASLPELLRRACKRTGERTSDPNIAALVSIGLSGQDSDCGGCKRADDELASSRGVNRLHVRSPPKVNRMTLTSALASYRALDLCIAHSPHAAPASPRPFATRSLSSSNSGCF